MTFASGSFFKLITDLNCNRQQEELYAQLYEQVRAYVLGYVYTRAARLISCAEDIVQEVEARVFSHLEDFLSSELSAGAAQRGAWLKRITQNVCRDYYDQNYGMKRPRGVRHEDMLRVLSAGELAPEDAEDGFDYIERRLGEPDGGYARIEEREALCEAFCAMLTLERVKPEKRIAVMVMIAVMYLENSRGEHGVAERVAESLRGRTLEQGCKLLRSFMVHLAGESAPLERAYMQLSASLDTPQGYIGGLMLDVRAGELTKWLNEYSHRLKRTMN